MRIFWDMTVLYLLKVASDEWQVARRKRFSSRASVLGRSTLNLNCSGRRNYANCRIYPVLRIYPVNHPGEGDDFTDVLGAGDPCDGAFEAEAETCVGDAAVAAEVQVPLEGLYW